MSTWAERRQVFERVRQTSPAPHVNHYDVAENRIDMILDGGATTSLWSATKNEWLGLIDVAGLEVETLHGDFNGSELDSTSREYVFVTRRP